MGPVLRISDDELRARRRHVLSEVGETGGDAFVSYSPTSIFYLTNFYFIPTERPIALLLTAEGRAVLFVPRLEVEHAEEVARVDSVAGYPEYPSDVHPMRRFADVVRDARLADAMLVAEGAGYGSSQGYEGPPLGDLLPEATIKVDGKLVERMRMVKSPAEIELIKESCRWGNYAHERLQDLSRPGAGEVEISARASHEATAAMLLAYGRAYRPLGPARAMAGFRGQIGPNSALPHAVTINATLRTGDVLVTGAGAGVGGYHSELERTMFVREPSPEQRWYFEHMLAIQDLSLAAIRPGIPCSRIDEEVRRYYDEHDLWPLWRHHVGHNIGLLGHEAPFLDIGDPTAIEEGMLFTVEPGLYVAGLGGFRHSDTVVVTADGIEMLTYYPRDLESLIC